LEKFSREETAELESFLTIWTAIWMKKWQERVKLFIGNQSKNELNELYKTLAKAGPIWQTLDCKQELIDIIESTLINNGEICGTENLAEYTLKAELAKNNPNFTDKAQALTFLNNVMHRAHEIAKTSGPLMFVEANKAYYSSVAPQK
jgi:predicted peroxiredoxin